MDVTLVGGGPESASSELLAPFLAARKEGAVAVIMAGDSRMAAHFAPEYLRLLGEAASDARIVPLSDGLPTLADVGGLVVAGGPTPMYYEALAPRRTEVRRLVDAGIPYLGFSAGAMITGPLALVGGDSVAGVRVCPEDWSEGLDEVRLEPGLDLVPWIVDVHVAQAGTLGRAVAVAARDPHHRVLGIDEGTAVHLDGAVSIVLGTGSVWMVRSGGRGVEVTRHTAGARVTDTA